MSAAPKVASLQERIATASGTLGPVGASRPWVLIVESPKPLLVAAVLVAAALLVTGAIAGHSLGTPAELACKAASSDAPGRAIPPGAADNGSAPGDGVRKSPAMI
jgi:hypothetical protein